MDKHNIQCFWGEQETHYDMEKTVSVKTESDSVKVAVITNQNKIVTADLSVKPSDSTNVEIEELIGEGLQSDLMSMAQVSSQSSN